MYANTLIQNILLLNLSSVPNVVVTAFNQISAVFRALIDTFPLHFGQKLGTVALPPCSEDGTFSVRPSIGNETGKLLPRTVQGVLRASLRQGNGHPSWTNCLLSPIHH